MSPTQKKPEKLFFNHSTLNGLHHFLSPLMLLQLASKNVTQVYFIYYFIK